ncbi:unnamed protein product [Parnassius apollo]|uniref:Regulatory protein zeste n=1 Tax=Parnassius apollo TaxID=110799 RepID=A0A8S3XAP1_PARAO|nr:unnamed protein product [Parnassius apollo]
MDKTGPSGNKRKRVALNTSTNEKILSQWIEAELEREFSVVDDEEVDPDFCLHSDHNSASEQSEDEETQSQRQRSPRSSVAMQDSGLSSIQDNIHTESQRYYIGAENTMLKVPNFTSDEKALLAALIKSKPIVESKATDGKSVDKKKTAWESITQEFNCQAYVYKTAPVIICEVKNSFDSDGCLLSSLEEEEVKSSDCKIELATQEIKQQAAELELQSNKIFRKKLH